MNVLPSHTKQIQAVVEVLANPVAALWDIGVATGFVRLWGKTSHLEVGAVMHTLLQYNGIDTSHTPEVAFANLFEPEMLVLPGGLQMLEHGLVKVVPGCCGGLEDWRDWHRVADGHTAIFAGHDPKPNVEILGQSIRVWADAVPYPWFDTPKKVVPNIDLLRQEFLLELTRVEQDLLEFLQVLRMWLQDTAPISTESVVGLFDAQFRITK
jgi:hypothetical protein